MHYFLDYWFYRSASILHWSRGITSHLRWVFQSCLRRCARFGRALHWGLRIELVLAYPSPYRRCLCPTQWTLPERISRFLRWRGERLGPYWWTKGSKWRTPWRRSWSKHTKPRATHPYLFMSLILGNMLSQYWYRPRQWQTRQLRSTWRPLWAW